jgi:hypothetical protein
MRTETANAQESVATAIKNLATTSLRGGLRERPPPEILKSPTSPRGGSRAYNKDSFFLSSMQLRFLQRAQNW